MEQDDDDLTRFWSYVFAALSRVHPGSGASALAILQGSAAQPDPQQLPPIETVLILQAWLLFYSGKHDEALLYLEDTERTFGLTPVSHEPGEHQTIPGGMESLAEIKGRIATIRASIAVSRGTFREPLRSPAWLLSIFQRKTYRGPMQPGIWGGPTGYVER